MKVVKVSSLRQKSRNQNGNGRRTAGNISIPQLRTNVIKRHRFRFVAASAVSVSGITSAMLLGTAGTICIVTNSTVANIAKSVKIQSIEVWAPTATSTTATTCAVEWSGSVNSPNMEVSDTSINVSRPAHIKTSPPPQSTSSFWQVTGSSALFNLTCPAGSIVDVTLHLIENDQPTVSGVDTVATGVLGEMYYLPLDGTATHLLLPISLNSTF